MRVSVNVVANYVYRVHKEMYFNMLYDGNEETTNLMYKNIICFFTFFITKHMK